MADQSMPSMVTAVNPVIIHKSLLCSELYLLIRNEQLQFKIRISANVPVDSCVFPKSQITFTILNIVNDRQIFTDAYQSQLFERFDKLSKMYYAQYVCVILPAPSSRQPYQSLLIKLYDRYLTNDNLKIIPFHNISDCMKTMSSLTQVNIRSVKDIIHIRHSDAMKGIIINEDNVISAIKELDLSTHEAYVLIDGCGGNLEYVSQCNVTDLLNVTSLDKETAKKIVHTIDHTNN